MIGLLIAGMIYYTAWDFNHTIEQDKKIAQIEQQLIAKEAEVIIWQNQYGKGFVPVKEYNKIESIDGVYRYKQEGK